MWAQVLQHGCPQQLVPRRISGTPFQPLLLTSFSDSGDDDKPQGEAPVALLLVEGTNQLYSDVYRECFEKGAGQDGR